MEAITTRTKIRAVATGWRLTFVDPGDGRILYPEQRAKQPALDALDPETATAGDVEAIIGNGSWVAITCDECNQLVGRAVRLGPEPDYESATAVVCRDCLVKALALLDAAE